MHPDCDLDLSAVPPVNATDLRQDLGLEHIVAAAARGDQFLWDVTDQALLHPLTDPARVLYRQHALSDCLWHPQMLRDLYAVTVEAVNAERAVHRAWFLSTDRPDTRLSRAVSVLDLLVDFLRRLRTLGEQNRDTIASPAFTSLFTMFATELSEDYLASITEHLRLLHLRDGSPMAVRIGPGNRVEDYRLLRPERARTRWVELLPTRARTSYSFEIPARDESGLAALAAMRDAGLTASADVLVASATHVLNFFRQLRAELAFYVGALNLHERLTELGLPTSFPHVHPDRSAPLSFTGLYDLGLALRTETRPVGNDLRPGTHALLVITGANSGGKSTFLRSIGIAQLLAQAGMGVPAEAMDLDLHSAVFTHFRREEDATMTSGKLDEELLRMSAIADAMEPGALMLFNESFASTYEREGSEIARDIVHALLDRAVRVVYVTHMYDLAQGFTAEHRADITSLRAERQTDGTRTFRIVEQAPLPTSYGADLYDRVFGAADHPAAG
jgi:hypothetical protein